jgi:hypothetical protein
MAPSGFWLHQNYPLGTSPVVFGVPGWVDNRNSAVRLDLVHPPDAPAWSSDDLDPYPIDLNSF